MRKKLVLMTTALLCLVLTVCILAACDEDMPHSGISSDAPPEITTQDGFVLTLISDTECELDEYVGDSANPVIPSEAEGRKLTSVRSGAFYGASIESVTIPDSVVSIGSGAFENCISLTSVALGNGVRAIDDYAFHNSGLESVSVPDSVTVLGDSVFRDCGALRLAHIGRGVADIGERIFANCPLLSIISVDEENPVFHSDGECLIETESKVLRAGCSASVIPSDGSVKSVADEAFTACTFVSVAIPDAVTHIGDGAFAGCGELRSITIPHNVNHIGKGVFGRCGMLTSISVAAENAAYQSTGNCLVERASKTLVAGCSASVIPSDGSVTSIGEEAFFGHWALTSAVIPDSVTDIGASAFDGCSALRSLSIGRGVSNIGESAFAGCSELTSVSVPSGVTSIKPFTFGDCVALTSVELPDSVTRIEYSAFSGCKSLTAVNIPDGVTAIGEQAFSGCSALTSVTIPYGVTVIESMTFLGCESLASVVIPANVTEIGFGAFLGCQSLATLTIPDSVTVIAEFALASCPKLTAVNYYGTTAQWNAIDKREYWSDASPLEKVLCSDGTAAV